MIFRQFAVVAAAGVGLALFAGQARAQYYSPRAYPAPGAYQAAPADDDADVITAEDDDQVDVPAPINAPQAAPPSYPGVDGNTQQGGYPYDSRVERAPLPGSSVPQASQQQPAPGYAPLQDQRAIGNPTPLYSDRGPTNGVYGNQRPEAGGDAPRPPATIETNRGPQPADPGQPTAAVPPAPGNVAALPPEDQPEVGEKELPAQFRRQIVDYLSKEPAGTIVIDTPSTYLYYVLGGGKAIRYGIGVGRDGFTWSGTERITKVAEWPDWYPPAEMIERQPYLPRMMAGGPGNPLGARALYLGKTVYRIHGTNQPSTIGQFVSSGCIRMLNEDVEDLYTRVRVGTRVVVRPAAVPATASAGTPVAGNATATR